MKEMFLLKFTANELLEGEKWEKALLCVVLSVIHFHIETNMSVLYE